MRRPTALAPSLFHSPSCSLAPFALLSSSPSFAILNCHPPNGLSEQSERSMLASIFLGASQCARCQVHGSMNNSTMATPHHWSIINHNFPTFPVHVYTSSGSQSFERAPIALQILHDCRPSLRPNSKATLSALLVPISMDSFLERSANLVPYCFFFERRP